MLSVMIAHTGDRRISEQNNAFCAFELYSIMLKSDYQ